MPEEPELEHQWAAEDIHIPVEHRQALADTRIPSAMEGEFTAKDTEGTVEPPSGTWAGVDPRACRGKPELDHVLRDVASSNWSGSHPTLRFESV